MGDHRLQGKKEPDYWGLPSYHKDFGLFITKINDISLKKFKLGRCLMIDVSKILAVVERIYDRRKDRM